MDKMFTGLRIYDIQEQFGEDKSCKHLKHTFKKNG